ncbi:MAG: succinate dehydrogenase cytochrome b subunit [Putridiphycobacter sp.]
MKSSIGRKILMALSGFFLLVFLLQHLLINMLSVISPDMFNEVSHFMGYNPVIQFLMQPILIFGIIFHLVMGMYLEAKNRKARVVKYAKNNAGANSSWVSRNMIITGIMVLLFLVAHMSDFWVHEMNYKYIAANPEDPTRYWTELHHEMGEVIHVAIYTLAFIFLSLHLMHGFQSAFQSVGFNHNKYTPFIKKLGVLYAIVVPLGFIVVAWFHFLTQSH